MSLRLHSHRVFLILDFCSQTGERRYERSLAAWKRKYVNVAAGRLSLTDCAKIQYTTSFVPAFLSSN